MFVPLFGETHTIDNPARNILEGLLSRADVRLDGSRPWDIGTNNPRLYRRLLCHGALGLGESYMDGWWDCEQIDELVRRLLESGLNRRMLSPKELIDYLEAKCMNKQCGSRAWLVGRHHYDIGDDLYRCMLDDNMLYSCAYWKEADDLNAAQEAKLELIAKKLLLQEGMRVLDIGCGWGGAARYLARHYGVTVTGVTISKNQAAAAAELCRGLPVDIRLEDYRNLTGKFDRIFSVGMFEHVGYKNYKSYMRIVRDLLVEDGLFLLHTIGNDRKAVRTDPWIERYIFPGSMLPAEEQLVNSFKGIFLLEDWHNFGIDYDTTLMHWYRKFEAAWPQLADRYGKRFYRMWKYYLLSCAGSFRARKNQLWQLVLSPTGVKNGYVSIR
jgi:cyclopropane-fatty-acyl-phospholipid synthase